MKDQGKELFGVIDNYYLENNKIDFIKMQILDPNLKNYLGESNLEVRKRMKEAIFSIISQNIGKRIAIVSHGGSIKFYLLNGYYYIFNKTCRDN